MNNPTLKEQLTAEQVVQGLLDGKTYTQIAQDMKISRTTLYDRMRKQQVQQLMKTIVSAIEVKVPEWIQELHDSPHSKDKRKAVTELGKLVRRVDKKLSRTIQSNP